MIFKVIGSAAVLLCGALYSKFSQISVTSELVEVKRLISLFRCLESEIGEFGTPLNRILLQNGVDGGINGLVTSVTSDRLRTVVKEARTLGRGPKSGDVRICTRICAALEAEKSRLEASVGEVKVISRVKGLGIAAAVVILLW